VKVCVRCAKPVEPGRRRYCGDACADSAARDAIKLRKAGFRGWPKRLYRTYDYRKTEP